MSICSFLLLDKMILFDSIRLISSRKAICVVSVYGPVEVQGRTLLPHTQSPLTEATREVGRTKFNGSFPQPNDESLEVLTLYSLLSLTLICFAQRQIGTQRGAQHV